MQCSVSIIGPGNWGTSLATAVLAAGIPLRELILSRPGKHSLRQLKHPDISRPFISLGKAALDADVLWLCVPDSAIGAVTERVAKQVAARHGTLKGQIVVHSSGALNVLALAAATQSGASVGSVHPVMTFPTRVPVSLRGVPFGIEADPLSRRVLKKIVENMGGRPFPIKTANKALYHAVGMLCSPLLVSHLAAAQQVAALAGLSPRQARTLIGPITRATLENVLLHGIDKSFSGPIARNDLDTIRLHLQALDPHPILAEVYRSLALNALEALPSPGSQKLRKLLRSK
jgi:predicted short-subunit dehydrogenase-like oxidoreductase (DUF2520 family)